MSTAHGEQVRILEEHVGEVGRGINWWGMMFFISSEALIFANLIAAYLYLEIRNTSQKNFWVLPSGEHLDWKYPLFNTALLLLSSVPAIWARSSIAKGNKRNLVLGLTGTIVLGLAFLVDKFMNILASLVRSLASVIAPLVPAFFTLTGFHGLHVTIGVLFLTVCLIRAIRGDFTQKKHFAVEAGEMYWHFVDLVWVVVFSTVYLLPLLRG